ncbi:MAG: DUF3341 domain-containing protein [Phycisphaerales bacterium]
MALLDMLQKLGAHNYLPIPRPAPRFVTESGAEVYGVLAEFHTPSSVYQAAEKVRDKGFTRWDVFTPFPIHGIEEAMGVKRTILPVIMACGAFTGTFLALLMQWWMGAIDYPTVVQGKPHAAWEPWVPITFELSILLGSFTVLIAMLMLNGLPRWHHPLFASDRFLRVSQDRFAIAVEAVDPKFDPHEVRRLLESAGAKHVELIEE